MTAFAISESARFTSMQQQTARMSQLQYGYSDSVLDHLREQVALPARLETAVIRRQVDFLAGRLCARRALRAAGFEGRAEIRTEGHGAPVWPEGYRGSISHCEGLAVAVAGRAQDVSAIGIDIERLISVDMAGDIRRQCASDEELTISRHSGMPAEAWLTTLFSAKESLFKALYPGVGRYFDFLDAAATELDAHDGSLTLTLRVALSNDHPAGKAYPILFQWSGNVVMTRCELVAGHDALVVPAGHPATGLHDREIHRPLSG